VNEAAEKSELEKAVDIVFQGGYKVVHPLALVARPYIREISDVLEAAEFRLDEAKVERNEGGRATGRILLAVFPFKVLERLEKEG
jgi:hypothetical protein